MISFFDGWLFGNVVRVGGGTSTVCFRHHQAVIAIEPRGRGGDSGVVMMLGEDTGGKWY